MKRAENNTAILRRIHALKGEHPLWGYRRVWAYLKYREGLPINKKRIYRLMKEHTLLVQKNQRLKAPRTLPRSKPRATKPNELWGIDMTKIMVPTWGWVYLHVVLDWYSKKIVGYNLSIRSKAQDWREALESGLNKQFPQGAREARLKLVSDHGSQPTSTGFIKACGLLGITQIFTSYDNPKGNADTERMMRTIKEDLIWPHEWHTPFELQDALDKWVKDYNEDYPHSSLKYNTPCEYERMYMANTT